jgi:uncharacterized protein
MIKKYFFKDNEFKLIKIGDNNSVFFTDSLQIYNIEDQIISDYFNCCTQKEYASFDMETADFLKNKFVDVIKKNKKPVIAKYNERKINSIALILTENCNLRCNYCYAYKGENSKCLDMDISTAKSAIDLLFKNNPNSEGYGIIFFGGEPLLNYNLMKEVVLYAKELFSKNNKQVGFTMTTNGTILSSEIIKLLKEHNFSIQVSFDGPKEIHNKNRYYANGKGSFEKVLQNIKTIKENDIIFSLRTTIPANSNFYEIIKFMEELQISFGFGFTVNTKFKSKSITDYVNKNFKEFDSLYEKLMNYYFEKFSSGAPIYCSNIKTCLDRIENQLAKKISCTAGRAMMTVDPSGDIFTCQNIPNYKEARIGTIKSNINKFINNKFIAPNVERISECNKCWIKYLCAGGCYYEKYVDNKDVFKPSWGKCEILKIQWEHHLRLYQKLKKNHINSFNDKEEVFV